MRFWRLWRKLYRIVRVNYKAYLPFCVMLALRGMMRGWNFNKTDNTFTRSTTSYY